MAGKSFKDYYSADKDAPRETNKIAEQYVEEPAEAPVTPITNTNVDDSIGYVGYDSSQTISYDNTAIREALTEQKEQTRKMLKSVTATNKKIAESVEQIVEANRESSDKLAEAITALAEKMELLESKLDAIENLEIPTPIVNLSMPNKKIKKDVHRDKKGRITHITESEVFDEEDEDGDE